MSKRLCELIAKIRNFALYVLDLASCDRCFVKLEFLNENVGLI